MDCIKCDGELVKAIIDDVQVDKCDKCSGIWFDFGELKKVLDSSNIDTLRNLVENNMGHDSQKSKCPRCKGEGNMVQVASLESKGIHIDTCSVCYGQWLDGGEIEKLKEKGIASKIKGVFGLLIDQSRNV